MRLREYIASGRGTITQIGDATGVSGHAVRKWMYGQREPDIETAHRIERLTEGAVTVAELSKARASASTEAEEIAA